MNVNLITNADTYNRGIIRNENIYVFKTVGSLLT